jgi:hypothetical protein
MKLGIKCKIDSETFIGNLEMNVVFDGKEYSLVSNSSGLLSEIIIKIKGPNVDKQIPKISPLAYPSPAQYELNLPLSKEDVDDVTSLLQDIESALSFSANLKKIYWEEPTYVFIPETDDERLNIDINKFTVHRSFPVVPKLLTIDNFTDILRNRNKYQFLTIAKAFHREGIREYDSFRFINAFYNFYYVIEDLYGAGKTKNAAIENEFKKDVNFREIVAWMMEDNIKDNHLENIKLFIAEEHRNYDVDGLIELIVHVRGNLHHFSSKSSKRKGTPFNHQDFESMAFLLMGLSTRSILQKIIEKNNGII